MTIRPRRLRRSAALRDLVHEVDLKLEHLIQPYFVAEGAKTVEPIQGFTGINRYGIDALSARLEKDLERGVKSFLLFGKAAEKDAVGSGAYAEKGLVPEALRALRKRLGKAPLLITDVCLCPYTSHGHCGVVKNGEVDNDASLEPLSRMALTHAQAGADIVSPSDMMDGRVGAIRKELDRNGFSSTAILAYTAKYASAYYGPFREALDSSPSGDGGSDRSTYQMDFRNGREALRELALDQAEGADMVMVKPALAYLDIIAEFRRAAEVPVVAYSVSGEYEMVKRLAQAGMCDEKKLALENLTAIRRAGASAVITYYASEGAEKGWLK